MIEERHQAFGTWGLSLKPETPNEILDAIADNPLGTIYITPSPVEPGVDPKDVAVYAGILRKRNFTESRRDLEGSSLVWLLGDQQSRGPGISETLEDLTGDSFVDSLTTVLSDTDITPGNIIAEVGGLPNGKFLLQTARYKIERICAQYEAEYLVTPQGELDAGTPASLFPTFNDPVMFIKRGATGVDPSFKPLRLASAEMGSDFTNWANKKIIAADVDGVPTIVGTDTEATAYRGPNGTLLQITDVSADSTQDGTNGDARAAALLALLVNPRNTVSLATEDFDAFGDFGLGDSLYVWEPDVGFLDMGNPITFRGELFYPLKLRVFGFNWPIRPGMGVYYRDSSPSATVTDLSRYYLPEEGQTTVDVGAEAKPLVPPAGEVLSGIVAPETNPGDPPPTPATPTVASDERQIYVTVPTTGFQLSVTKVKVYASETTGFTPGPTNYIGDIPVSRANINLSQSVAGRFPWPAEDVFVRVSALNHTEGPASAEVSDTVPLIPSLAILELAAEKILAGTISVSVLLTAAHIVGGVVETAASGQRVALEEGDPDRINWYSGHVSETSPATTYVGQFNLPSDPRLVLGCVSPTVGSAGQSAWVLFTEEGGSPAAFDVRVSDSASLEGYLLVEPEEFQVWIDGGEPELRMTPTSAFLRLGAASRRLDMDTASVSLYYGDSSTAPSLILNASNPQFRWASGSRRVSVGTDFLALYYGDSSDDPRLVLNGTSASLKAGAASGETLLLTATDVTLAHATSGRRFYQNVTHAQMVGTDNVVKFEVNDTYVESWRDLTMNDWKLALRSVVDNNYVQYVGGGLDGPRLQGNLIPSIRSATRDCQIQVGVATNEAGCFNNAASDWADFSAYINDVSDPSLKTILDLKLPDALRDVMATQFFLYQPINSKEGTSPFLGASALEMPDYVTTPLSMTVPTEGNRYMKGIRISSGIAWIGRAVQQLTERVQELEKDKLKKKP